MLLAARTRRALWMAASLTVMRFSVMESSRLVHESGRPICHQSLACLNASSCANDAASAPKFDANCSAMMPICRPGSLPFPPPCKATHTQPINWWPSPPRIPPADPLEWSRFEHQCLPPVTGQIVPAASPPPLSPAAALRQQARLLARPARPRLPHQRLRTAPSLRHLDRGQQGPHRFARCPS